ncbi:MAG: sulfide/dihydroorotate dehydrogenase-like FAD/NAD-binding protein [Candidatus Thorarchaeota archaeon]|jgi:ferredoxin--NADP+ reductase
MKGKIITNEEVVPNVRRLILEASDIAQRAKPGQFIMIIPDAYGERVPFTLSDWDADAGTITVFYLEAGVSTMKLARLKAGECVHTLVGPLGRPTKIEKIGTVVLGGGCYGLGAIYPLARAYKEAGNKVISIIEGRTTYILYNDEKLSEVSDEVLTCTSDGSRGLRGHIPDVIEEIVKRGEKIDHAHFVGCTYSMMISSNSTKPHEIPTMVSLNALMVDGTGMCGCCRVIVGGTTKFACVDGPDFDGHQVDWDMVFARAGAYVPEENLSYQFQKLREDGSIGESASAPCTEKEVA